MCLNEGRIQTIELYIKVGKRLKATIGQLGYPPTVNERTRSVNDGPN